MVANLDSVALAEAALNHSASFIKERLPDEMLPEVLIICGSGLGDLANTLESSTTEFNYSDIPNFVTNTVAGHAGKLVFGQLSGVPTVCMVGRFHFYEGHAISQTAFPVRVMKLLGVKVLVVTNAAGGLNPEYQVGDIVIMNDHISLVGMSGNNPLVGANIDNLGPRFPAMSDAYDFTLRRICYRAAKAVGLPRNILREGVYAMVAGPNYESRAEARFLRQIGADVVGMSTVPEVVVARHCDIRVLGLSLVTNRVIMDVQPCADEDISTEAVPRVPPASHEEVLATSAARSRQMQALVAEIVLEIKKIM